MADVTTAAVDGGTVTFWDIPQGVTGVPRGEVIYQGSQLVPATENMDTSMFTLTLNLPRNWAYKMMELRVFAQAIDNATFVDYDTGIHVTASTDKDGVSAVFSDQFILWNVLSASTAYVSTGRSFVFSNPTDINFTEYARVPQLPGYFLDASDGGRLFLRWCNDTTDDTNAITIGWYAKLYQYSVEQIRSWAVHQPFPQMNA